MLLEEKIKEIFCEKKMTLSLAESCTGGHVSYRLISIAGASTYFLGSLIAYSNQSKIDLLNVNPKTLEKNGAVSAPTALEMAKGAKIKFKSNIAIATTGIAGPTGGSIEKPVGLVYFALANENEILSWKENFLGSRSTIIQSASTYILEKLFYSIK